MSLAAPLEALEILLQSEDNQEDDDLIENWSRFLTEGKAEFQKKWESKYVPRGYLKDFDWLVTLGKGSFGRVVLAKHNPTRVYCAVKILDKGRVILPHTIKHTRNEMKILISLNFRFLVYMLYAMKDENFIYFVMPFVIGGEMSNLLRRQRRFTEDEAKFYAAQLCLALEYLHYLDVVHRDIKPENILIDHQGYLKVTDMGFCKIVTGRTYTFCGTPYYLAPEIILNKGYGKAVDWWSYGVLLYEMSAGYPPFHAEDPMKMYGQITSGEYYNSRKFSTELKDLISHLLEVDITKRYGNLKNGVDDIKDHKWFEDINWLSILNYKVTAPHLPKYTQVEDFPNMPSPTDTPINVPDGSEFNFQFETF